MAVQTINDYDPTDPAGVIRNRALQQAQQQTNSPVAVSTQPAATSSPSTPSPTFANTPTSSAAPTSSPAVQPTTAPGPANSGGAFKVPGPNGTMIDNPNLGPIGPATSAPTSYNSPPVDPALADRIATYIQQNGLQANQGDPRALSSIVTYLRSQGVNAQVDYADANGHTGGILINGQPYQLINGSNQWTPLQPWEQSGGNGGGGMAAPANPFLDQLKQLLMARIAKNSQPVNETDANIADPLNAARDETSRQSDAERTALAERLYAQGDLNSNSLTQGIQQSGERNAGALSSLRAQLITNELKARRDDLAQAMQLAVSAGDAESARAIQVQLSQLNAQIQREGLGVTLAVNRDNQNAGTVHAAAPPAGG